MSIFLLFSFKLILNENCFPNDSCNYSSRYPVLSELTRRTDTPKIIISPIFLSLIKDFNFIEFYMREISTKVIQYFTYTVRDRAHSDSIMTTFFISGFRPPAPPPHPVSQRHLGRSVVPSVMHATE